MARHRTDVVALLSGVLFLLAAAAYGIGRVEDVTVDATWLAAAALGAMGVAGLVAALVGIQPRARRSRDGD